MVLAKPEEQCVYYKETSSQAREVKFCLKQVQTLPPRSADKSKDAINVQVVKGKTTTFIHLDEEEARKVQHHADFALKKLQRIHKSVVWNSMVGRSYVDQIQKTAKSGAEEINIDRDENVDFSPLNPKTWSDDSLDFIRSVLRASEFKHDGFVVLFCVENNPGGGSDGVDYDEMAWELEKCVTYHYIASKPQIIVNEEATMARKGLDPVSRKTKTPGRKKSGFCVYLAYQLIDSVTHDQIVGESITKFIDIHAKKKQLLASLTEAKLQPQTDEQVRKSIKEVREFMPLSKINLVYKLKELKDPQSEDMVVQFLHLLTSQGRNSTSNMGLQQFLSFLNSKPQQQDQVDSSRMSNSPRGTNGHNLSPGSTTNRTSTLPRPTSTHTRKHSITSQTCTISSRSTTPETHSRMMSNSGPPAGTELESIPGSSGSSTPDTLRRPQGSGGHGVSSGAPSRQNGQNGSSRLPKRMLMPQHQQVTTASGRMSNSVPSPRAAPTQIRSPRSARVTPQSTPRATPRAAARAATAPANGRENGHATPSSRQRIEASHEIARRGSRTPSVASSMTSNSPSRGRGGAGSSRGETPTPTGKLITREDLRRMNSKSPKATGRKKPVTSSSYSRASIPM